MKFLTPGSTYEALRRKRSLSLFMRTFIHIQVATLLLRYAVRRITAICDRAAICSNTSSSWRRHRKEIC
ncbi:hypothetical protein BC832DRAFT_560768 [Gaertneriomyces semiglobifer]|nr:hypothetical protein BC832DRAFT_560768 [Gaertneriomyces semiglobifer]